ncbi:tautomerase family protein [Hymenobacter metallicola]|uniref:4-oxalocrotonate tautomerase n=1 Tax=Hymenobacter metallicola TaxID=2563114 RepID=A0A4Z0PZ56_9BACT|nr:tautomerase family protein [Hymenobacter metallicola]TGE22725.1 4-oxalocrotonate tautomerase [Hymenobacter metallicola]
MAHSIKLALGSTEEQKQRLAAQIVRAMGIAGTDEASVFAAIEEVPPVAWMEQVYQADILPH